MMKWIAGVVVILGCGYLGIAYAGTIESRIRQLETLEQMLSQLEFNMVFLLQPFPQAVKLVAESYTGSMSRFFSRVADGMMQSPELSPEKVFLTVLEKTPRVRFQGEECEILRDFFRHTGQGDKEGARDGIRMTAAKLRLVRESVEKDREKDGKLWRSIGFLGGILIVLLLV